MYRRDRDPRRRHPREHSGHDTSASATSQAAQTGQHTKQTTSAKHTKPSPTSATQKGAPIVHDTSSSSSSGVITHYQSSGSTIHYGPAITASSLTGAALPPSQTTASHSSESKQTSDISGGSKKALIAVTTIGGTLILALLIYALWRRRKGATYSEIAQFRRHSSTINLSSSRSERLTALPIYQESRFSVRSSKLGSTLSFGKMINRFTGVPPDGATSSRRQHPWAQDTWKTANPPTPIQATHPLSQVMNSSPTPPTPPLKPPAMVRVNTDQSTRSQMTNKSYDDNNKSGVAVSTEEATPDIDDTGSVSVVPGSRPDVQDRWSWTNSQAPPTPKIYATSRRSSISTLPRFKTVAAWVKGQTERQQHGIDDAPPLPTHRAITELKNKALKPALAPKPTRKLSKRNREQGGFPYVAQPVPDVESSTPPAPAKRHSRNASQSAIKDQLFASGLRL